MGEFVADLSSDFNLNLYQRGVAMDIRNNQQLSRGTLRARAKGSGVSSVRLAATCCEHRTKGATPHTRVG